MPCLTWFRTNWPTCPGHTSPNTRGVGEKSDQGMNWLVGAELIVPHSFSHECQKEKKGMEQRSDGTKGQACGKPAGCVCSQHGQHPFTPSFQHSCCTSRGRNGYHERYPVGNHDQSLCSIVHSGNMRWGHDHFPMLA